MSAQKVIVNDKMQQRYEYMRTEGWGENFHENFRPNLTPAEMLSLGVFGGVYLRDCRDEFPAELFKDAILAPAERTKPDCKLNYFEVCAGQKLSIWQQKGWLHKDDPRGWFQWYCRYYYGRRHEDDERQIKRWWAFRRHASQIINHCRPGDLSCRVRQRQALLQWAYDSRK